MKLTEGWNLCGIKILDEKTKSLPVYFHSIGHYPGQKHVFRPNGLGQYQMCICTNGCGMFSSNGIEYDIKRGDVFFLSPSVGHEYYPRDNEWTVIWVVFNGKDVKSVIDYFYFKDSFVCCADESILCDMINVCERIFATYNKNECYDFALTIDMLELIALVNKCDKTVKYNSKKGEKNGFSHAIDYIKKNYMHLITLDDMADAIGLSKSHFCRQFKEFYNVTPMIYLNRYRVSVAKFLLSTTIEGIDVIAQKTGFSDTSYFCAVFKKMEGVSPGQYRQRHEKQ